MMQMIQKKFFDRKFNKTDWSAESPEDLYKINKHVYKKLGFNPFWLGIFSMESLYPVMTKEVST